MQTVWSGDQSDDTNEKIYQINKTNLGNHSFSKKYSFKMSILEYLTWMSDKDKLKHLSVNLVEAFH